MTAYITSEMIRESIISEATRGMTARERCVASIPAGTKSRVELYNIEIDRSSSVGDINLKSLFGKGLSAMVSRMDSNSKVRNRIAFVRIVVFGSKVELLMDWTDTTNARTKVNSLVAPKASGVTRLDLAVRDGMNAIDSMKEYIDKNSSAKRGGSVNFIVTDGRITDDNGNEIGFPSDLSEEISERQSNRVMSSIALGIGPHVAESQLSKLAPPVVLKSGVRISRAAMYKDEVLFSDSEEADHFWVMVSQLIADTSSKNSTPGFNEAVLSLDGFEIVGA